MKIISEWKKRPKNKNPIPRGYKRVEAIVDNKTRHIDIKNEINTKTTKG